MTVPPHIPETAPFTSEQRAWLNGFLAGLFASMPPGQPIAPPPNSPSPRPHEPLLILFGSQTGTAERLARRLARDAEPRGFSTRVLALDEYEKAGLKDPQKLILISSTWGDGDPPDNAVNFWGWLNSDAAPRLDHVQFAVLGLGDRNYADFCGAAKKFDARLEVLGARRLVPRGECDVDYETPASDWAKGLWEKLGGNSAVPHDSSPVTNGVLNGKLHAIANEVFEHERPHGKSNPFPARLLRNVLLSKPGSAKEVRHFEFSLADGGLVYEVGDALGVVPANCPALVDQVLASLRCNGDEPVQVGADMLPLREALNLHLDLTRPTPELLAAFARAAPAGELGALLSPERADDLRQWLAGRDVLDILNYAASPVPPANLVSALRKLSPRLYSIASSPRAHPAEVHLTISTVRYEHLGRQRKGVASTHLADRVSDANRVKVFIQPAPNFKLPADSSAPIIMVGPGTGIAPFRAFLEERQATGARGKNWLFFGDQCRATDFLYEAELSTWHHSGHLARLDVAFSRDQAHKVYVQDRLRERAGEVWSWLEEGAHFYVCGDASRMAKDVDQALHGVIETAGARSAEDAKAYVSRMKAAKRYQRDVY